MKGDKDIRKGRQRRSQSAMGTFTKGDWVVCKGPQGGNIRERMFAKGDRG